MTTMAVTSPVVTAPSPFIASLVRHTRPRTRSQWRTMPACERVKHRKTPTA